MRGLWEQGDTPVQDRIPSPLVVLFLFMVLVALLCWFLMFGG